MNIIFKILCIDEIKNRSNLNKKGGGGVAVEGEVNHYWYTLLEISFIVNAYTEYYYTWDSEIKY